MDEILRGIPDCTPGYGPLVPPHMLDQVFESMKPSLLLRVITDFDDWKVSNAAINFASKQQLFSHEEWIDVISNSKEKLLCIIFNRWLEFLEISENEFLSTLKTDQIESILGLWSNFPASHSCCKAICASDTLIKHWDILKLSRIRQKSEDDPSLLILVCEGPHLSLNLSRERFREKARSEDLDDIIEILSDKEDKEHGVDGGDEFHDVTTSENVKSPFFSPERSLRQFEKMEEGEEKYELACIRVVHCMSLFPNYIRKGIVAKIMNSKMGLNALLSARERNVDAVVQVSNLFNSKLRSLFPNFWCALFGLRYSVVPRMNVQIVLLKAIREDKVEENIGTFVEVLPFFVQMETNDLELKTDAISFCLTCITSTLERSEDFSREEEDIIINSVNTIGEILKRKELHKSTDMMYFVVSCLRRISTRFREAENSVVKTFWDFLRENSRVSGSFGSLLFVSQIVRVLFHCITDDRIEQFPIGQLISMLEVSGKSLADSKSMDSKVVYSSLRKIVMILEKREGDIATVAMKKSSAEEQSMRSFTHSMTCLLCSVEHPKTLSLCARAIGSLAYLNCPSVARELLKSGTVCGRCVELLESSRFQGTKVPFNCSLALQVIACECFALEQATTSSSLQESGIFDRIGKLISDAHYRHDEPVLDNLLEFISDVFRIGSTENKVYLKRKGIAKQWAELLKDNEFLDSWNDNASRGRHFCTVFVSLLPLLDSHSLPPFIQGDNLPNFLDRVPVDCFPSVVVEMSRFPLLVNTLQRLDRLREMRNVIRDSVHETDFKYLSQKLGL